MIDVSIYHLTNWSLVSLEEYKLFDIGSHKLVSNILLLLCLWPEWAVDHLKSGQGTPGTLNQKTGSHISTSPAGPSVLRNFNPGQDRIFRDGISLILSSLDWWDPGIFVDGINLTFSTRDILENFGTKTNKSL